MIVYSMQLNTTGIAGKSRENWVPTGAAAMAFQPHRQDWNRQGELCLNIAFSQVISAKFYFSGAALFLSSSIGSGGSGSFGIEGGWIAWGILGSFGTFIIRGACGFMGISGISGMLLGYLPGTGFAGKSGILGFCCSWKDSGSSGSPGNFLFMGLSLIIFPVDFLLFLTRLLKKFTLSQAGRMHTRISIKRLKRFMFWILY